MRRHTAIGYLTMDIVINANHPTIEQHLTSISHYGNFYHNLFASLAVPDYPPVADLLRTQHHLASGMWLIVSPVYWQATHNDAMIIACGNDLTLPEKESRLWFEALREFLAQENIQLYYHDAFTWLLQCDGQPTIKAKPVSTLKHQSLMVELQQLDRTLFWQRLITEIQMFFSSHALNKVRLDHPINGVWIWGGGELPSHSAAPLVSFDRKTMALASLLSTQVLLYHPTLRIPRQAVLLVDEVSDQELIQLQERFKQTSVRWYWNNMAYLTKPTHWVSRLLEKFK